MLFTIFLAFILTQRIFELFVARNNEIWMKSRGALEFGKTHYVFMVLIHSLFFVVYTGEVFLLEKQISPVWPFLLIIFILTQTGRIWALSSLGKYWNTKIIVLPNADIVKKGPYRFLKHPNYVIVTIEFIVIPLMFQAYFTAFIFSFLNVLILSIRIPAEEKALKELTEYENEFLKSNRFVPNIFKKW
ncbi:isoprenylcysteine carboxylmethyltransferase family protein [Bacillus sp. 31A1R]|uniref:Isoprenylcysteine carboxylmethyltransferase family protein n=1 Tax=Robertmurraya mangrovi TaxID=3098077 RepID=A0ABU5J189_9BACI|nr:isoprenylcysteine carboxylmethyltransferase family protein [Bacillus sp. 31A1R]MDZ5473190.1 isoprenylcysteine carboxylmethyltransferase family protein [Bacillus sp. 31A1R]